MKHRFTIVGLAVVLCSLSIPVRAQYLDQIGVTLLRAMTTNLNGAGIRVAQPEASEPPFEVNPTAVGQPTNLFTYASVLGTATNYPNAVGSESDHANEVGRIFYGMTGKGIATNVAHVDNYDANYFVTNYVFQMAPASIVALVNESYTFGEMPISEQQQIDLAYDDYSVQFKVLFVSAANNYGTFNPPSSYNTTNVVPPGTSYNGISVGAYQDGVVYSSLGPTPDNSRCKPDITAPAGVTSVSTPQVSGAAAVLIQAALRGDGGADTNSAVDIRTIKTLLLNGAVKPANWTNSNVFPLDARYGAGVLNLFHSYWQLAGGKQAAGATNQVDLNGDHPPSSATNTVPAHQAWNFAEIASGETNDAVVHYLFDVSAGTATATLVWNRHTNAPGVNDLDLYLYRCSDSNLIARSDSYVNNVEHLWVTNLAAGRYDLQVVKYGGTNVVSDEEGYALAWQFTPPPILNALRGGTNVFLAWPLYPAGYPMPTNNQSSFVVETRTNLLSGTWNTNGLPVTIVTNGQNSIRLNMTNAAQFYRLRQPNF